MDVKCPTDSGTAFYDFLHFCSKLQRSLVIVWLKVVEYTKILFNVSTFDVNENYLKIHFIASVTEQFLHAKKNKHVKQC